MKTRLSILALSLCFLCNAQSIGEDELLHFTTGAVLSGGTYAFVYGKTKNKKKAFWYSLGVSTFAGLTKEILDQVAFDGYFDTSEFAATVAGGLVVSVTLDLFVGKKKKKQKDKITALRYQSANNILSR